MPDVQVVEWIREKYVAIAADLDERARRRWGAVEARSLGWGGIEAVAAATGMSDRTIRTGMKELDDRDSLPPWQQRHPGGGRKRREFEQPQLVESLQRLVDSGTRGDPMSPLRWSCKSTRTLAEELSRQGFSVSANTVGRLLRECGYSLRRIAKRLKVSSIRIGMLSSDTSIGVSRHSSVQGNRRSPWIQKRRNPWER